MTVPEPNEFRQHNTFPHFSNCTSKLPPQPASCTPLFLCDSSPLVVFAPSTAAYTFRFAYQTVFAVFCVCCFVLARIPCFLACQYLRYYPRQFFRGGAILHSGYTFSHYELPFPACYCIRYVRSGLFQLVIRVKGIRVCALHCVREVTSMRIAFEVFGVDTTLAQSQV